MNVKLATFSEEKRRYRRLLAVTHGSSSGLADEKGKLSVQTSLSR